MINSIWNEKHRVTDLKDFVCEDSIKQELESYIKNNDVPHLLLAGQAGVGKTTLAKLLVHNMECDSLIINASDENGIDIIREKVKNFAYGASFQKIKIIILDEADYLTKEAQAALRNVIESFSKTTRFILTCNYLEKIIDPLQSRCTTYKLTPPTKGVVAKRLTDILELESIKYELDDIVKIVNGSYPDVRKSINLIQQYSLNGVLKVEKVIKSNYIEQIIEVLDKKKLPSEIRQVIVDNDVKDFQEIYKSLYEKYFDNPTIIITLAEYQYKHVLVLDKEINFMACIMKITEELSKKKII